MTRSHRGAIWFNRLLLLAATFIMTMIALRTLRDPIGATQPLGIDVTMPAGATVVRVGFGGFPLGFAIALFACAISDRRLLSGVLLVATVVGAVMAARVQGLLVDGVTPYNLRLLLPEFAMLTLSAIGIALERRRRLVQRPIGTAAEPSMSI